MEPHIITITTSLSLQMLRFLNLNSRCFAYRLLKGRGDAAVIVAVRWRHFQISNVLTRLTNMENWMQVFSLSIVRLCVREFCTIALDPFNFMFIRKLFLRIVFLCRWVSISTTLPESSVLSRPKFENYYNPANRCIEALNYYCYSLFVHLLCSNNANNTFERVRIMTSNQFSL